MARRPARVFVGVKLDPAMIEDVDRWAGQRGLDRSEFIRWALGRVVVSLDDAAAGRVPVPVKSRPAPVAAPRAGVPTLDLLDGRRQVEPNFKSKSLPKEK